VSFAKQSALRKLDRETGESEMYTNVNLAAPIGVLLFLGTGFLLFVTGLALAYSVIRKKFGFTKLSLIAMAVIAGLYLGAMLIFSFSSSEKVLARGEEKHFCEIDCHLAYSIADVRETKTLDDAFNPGDSFNQVTAAGMFRLVTIKTRFDETTISSKRGNGPLTPNSRVVSVFDEKGNQYLLSAEGQRVLERSQAGGTPITTQLRPSETYTTTFVFDLPADIRNPTLLIQEGEVVTHFVIGHENSPLHKKTRFSVMGHPPPDFKSINHPSSAARRTVSLIRRVIRRGRDAFLITARRGDRVLRRFARQ
jgi:hypothetical protein